MAHRARQPAPLTVEQFLAVDDVSDVRHEFIDGRVYAMTGASNRHNMIAGNVYVALRTLSGGGPCRVYVEGVRLHAAGNVYYPDVMVDCAPDAASDRPVTDPCLLVEVLSPSTGYDVRYGSKLAVYCALPSVRAYLVVEQARRAVTRHWREATDAPWQAETIAGTGEVPVPCPVAGTLALDAIYRGTTPDDGDDAGAAPLRRVREGAAR